MSTAFTTAELITARVGALGVDLRTDDDPASLDDVIDAASARIDFYCAAYSAASLASSRWVLEMATIIAVYYLCMRRLNEVPKAVDELYSQALLELTKVQEGKASVPGAVHARRPVALIQQRVVLDRYPGVRVERPRSTGTAAGYVRRTDPGADASVR